MKTTPRQERRQWGLVIVVLCILTFCFLGIALFSLGENDKHAPQYLPISLHSKLNADYGSEANPADVTALGWNLIEDSIRDDRAGRQDGPARIATLTNRMQTPVHNVMPRTPTPTVQPTPTAVPTYRIPPFVLTPSTPRPTLLAPKSEPTSEPTPAPDKTLAPPPTAADISPAQTGMPGPAPTDKPNKEAKPTAEPKSTKESNPTAGPKATQVNK